MTEDGRIAGVYSNGQTRPLAQIGVAQFNADNFLKSLDGGALQQTPESGERPSGSAALRCSGAWWKGRTPTSRRNSPR